jgi:mannose-6-phosphate isomerase
MHPLSPALQHYAWGSPGQLPAFLGIEPTGEPVAEAWWGAHPAAPAMAHTPEGDVPLDAVIAADPQANLGASIARAFEGRLPFLLKVLAIARPLSIQVHPSAEQAREGFAREERSGIAAHDARRVYRDASPKPEMLVALTPMRVLAGFRPAVLTRADVASLEHPDAARLAATLDGPDSAAAIGDYLRLALTAVDAAGLAAEVVRVAARSGASASLRAAADAAGHFPQDAGVLVALAMNSVEMPAGDACYTAAGVVHSYQSGMGLEIMANSDNVVRAGLTPKHVDVEELLGIALTRPGALGRPEVERDQAATLLWPDAREFLLTLVEHGPAPFIAHPRIVLALEGETRVEGSAGAATLERGGAVFVPYSDGDITVSTTGRAAVAGVPLTDDDPRLLRDTGPRRDAPGR